MVDFFRKDIIFSSIMKNMDPQMCIRSFPRATGAGRTTVFC